MSRTRSTRSSASPRLRDAVRALETIAPRAYAQSWDNVGLLSGDLDAPCRRALICIDMMPAVVDEAIGAKAELVVAYHPPLFKPVSRLVVPSAGMEAGMFRCIANGIAVYSPHTAFDVAPGGTNDVLAEHCGMTDVLPLERNAAVSQQSKVVVFVPSEQAEQVARAMSDAGAGNIGEYRHCSFRSPGVGTFEGSERSHPSVGARGQLEHVDELRLEMICSTRSLPAVMDAIRQHHSYEEPAIDVYPLTSVPQHGIGRVGRFDKPVTVKALAQRLKRRTGARCVSMVGAAETLITRAIIGVGAAGSMPFSLGPGPGDVVVTGEMRHHDALRLLRAGACALVLSHWSSERPALRALAERLAQALPSLTTSLSQADREPFTRV